MSRSIIVSNRVLDHGAAAQAGGVAVALDSVLRQDGGLWFGWNGNVLPEISQRSVTVRRSGGTGVAAVPLSQREHQGYYLGYANSVLWPVFHGRLDLAKFEAGFFEEYAAVNRRFAALLRPLLRPDDVIWVHDYHFIPFAEELRRLGCGNPIGFFLHIPFPPAQTFLAVPEHRELARALSAYDLVGVQTRQDVANLLDYLRVGVAGRILQDGRIRVFERMLSIASFPIGIDPAGFAAPGGQSRMQVQGPPSAKRIIGVDRLDYTKGLPQKFRAFGRFLAKYPEYRGRVLLTQIASPTRESVEAYADIRAELESLSGSINGRFGELDWVPIHYIHRAIPRRKLVSIFRGSHIGMATPLRDGMNLVAKEYIAAQTENDPGVLILSQFAGAAEDLGDALIVNPYNIEEIAAAIRTAIEMSLEERVARYRALRAAVERSNVFAWSRSFLRMLTAVTGAKGGPQDLMSQGQGEPPAGAEPLSASPAPFSAQAGLG